jgi:hypothetical protein
MAKAKRLGRFSFKEERRLLKFALEHVSVEIAAARLKRPVATIERKTSKDGNHPLKRQWREKANLIASLCPEVMLRPQPAPERKRRGR